MEHAHGNPLFNKPLTAYVGQGQTRPSTSSDRPAPSRRQVSAKTKEAIAKLGLRYRPTSQTDLEAHAGQLAMLATDLHDLPVDLLERAIGDWSIKSPFMPKAFDLVQLAKSYLAKAQPQQREVPTDWEDIARRRNERMNADPEGRRGVRWVANATGATLELDPTYRTDMDRFMGKLHDRTATARDVERAPEVWRKIAEERGYLRRFDDGAFVIRERRCENVGL